MVVEKSAGDKVSASDWSPKEEVVGAVKVKGMQGRHIKKGKGQRARDGS